MKKITIFLGLCLLVLASCSGDDQSTTTSVNGTRLVKGTSGSPGGQQYEGNYLYSGPLLNKTTGNDGYWNQFTYTGLHITRIDSYRSATELSGITYLTYDSLGRLTERKTLSATQQRGFKTVFTYDADGNATMTEFTGNLVNQDTPSGNTTEKFYFENGLVTKREVMYNNDTEVRTYTYVYDGKNHMFKGIPGYAATQLGVGTGFVETTQNILTETSTSNMDSNVYIQNYTYAYNAMNYPTSLTLTQNGQVLFYGTYIYQ
jgi:hypothetical protein